MAKSYLDHDGLSYYTSKVKALISNAVAAKAPAHAVSGGITTAGTGAAYTATVDGITALTAGATFTMIPHTVSTSKTATLNVNSLGAKTIRRRVSNSTATTVAATTTSWLAANKPIRMYYDGTYWIADLDRPNATDIYGTVAIANGGTGATTAAAALTNLGAAAASHNHAASEITSGTLSSDRLPTVPIAKGGTGATTAAAALTNLGAAAAGHSHDDYMPKGGGTFTSGVTHNASIYMKNAVLINSYNPDGTVCGMINVDASGDLNVGTTSYPHSGDTYVKAPNGDVFMANSTGNKVVYRAYTSSANGSTSIFNPVTDGECMLGGSGTRWNRVFAALGEVQTSDEREKSDITAIADYPVMYSAEGEGNIWDKLFSKLVPKTYTMNIEDSGDVHIGFIAQDVEAAMTELGLTVDDVGFVIHDYWTDEETGEEKDAYGLAYDEFIALNTYMIQKQQAKIASLEERIAKLEELLTNS